MHVVTTDTPTLLTQLHECAQVNQLADMALERAKGLPVQRLWGTCEPHEAGGENMCANANQKV